MIAFFLMALGAIIGAITGSALVPKGLIGLMGGLFLGGLVGFSLGRLASNVVNVIARFIFWAFVGACVGALLGWFTGVMLDSRGTALIRAGALVGAVILMVTRGARGRGRGARLASSNSPARPNSPKP
jgi:hypothetical protein